MLKIQRLADVRELPLVAPSRRACGVMWVNVAPRTRRVAKAERLAQFARTDWQNADTLVRVRA